MESALDRAPSDIAADPDVRDRALRLAWYLVADLRAEPDALVHLEGSVLLPALEKVVRELGITRLEPGSVETIEAHFAEKHGGQTPNTLWLSWMGVSAAHRITTLVRSASASYGVVLRMDQSASVPQSESAEPVPNVIGGVIGSAIGSAFGSALGGVVGSATASAGANLFSKAVAARTRGGRREPPAASESVSELQAASDDANAPVPEPNAAPDVAPTRKSSAPPRPKRK